VLLERRDGGRCPAALGSASIHSSDADHRYPDVDS